MSRFLLFVGILGALCAISAGELMCYSCISQGDSNENCINNPAASSNPIVKCKYQYCTIRRLEYAAEPGLIHSFLRGCEEEPLPNGENPSADIVVWAQSCKFADLCNVGDGLSEITPDSVNNGNGGNSGNVIIVPGSSSALNAQKHVFVFTILVIILSFW